MLPVFQDGDWVPGQARMPDRPPDAWRREALRFVVNPRLRIERAGQSVAITVPQIECRITANATILPLLHFFSQPRTAAEFDETADWDRGILRLLHNTLLIVTDAEEGALRNGFLTRVQNPVFRYCSWPDLPSAAGPQTFVVFGVPSDAGSTHPSTAREGPRRIRFSLSNHFPSLRHEDDKRASRVALAVTDHNFRRTVRLSEQPVVDVGDVAVDGQADSDVLTARIRKVVTGILAAGAFPVMLGGDHSVTWGALAAVLSRHRRLGIIQFDAHTDLYRSADWRDELLNHANVFAFALGCPSVEVLHQIGLRACEVTTIDRLPVQDPRVTCSTAAEVACGDLDRALSGLPLDLPYYLSFDIDCLDPCLAPETAAPVFGGLSYYDAYRLVKMVAERCTLVGADFVEVCDSESTFNRAAGLTADLIANLVLTLTSKANPDRRMSAAPPGV